MDAAAVVILLVVSSISVIQLVTSHEVCYVGIEYSNDQPPHQRWVVHKDPCRCTAIRLGGVRAANHQQVAPYPLSRLVLSEDPSEIQAFFECPACRDVIPLGMENGRIPDSSLEASTLGDSGYHTQDSRLNSNSGWCANWQDNQHPWIRVDLGEVATVAGLITQGRHESSVWVTSYKVEYSQDESSWSAVTEDGVYGLPMEFQANRDHSTPVTVHFPAAVRARFVKILPATWARVNAVCLRFEVIGCVSD